MTNKKVTDHLGREVEFSYPPKRIISIVPGITDTLYSLELENEIVGRTRYCIYPKDKVEQAKTIGGTKKVKPDLRSEEHTSELQSRGHLVCRLLLEKNKTKKSTTALL